MCIRIVCVGVGLRICVSIWLLGICLFRCDLVCLCSLFMFSGWLLLNGFIISMLLFIGRCIRKWLGKDMLLSGIFSWCVIFICISVSEIGLFRWCLNIWLR